jgi:predicted nucleic acid-binding protein
MTSLFLDADIIFSLVYSKNPQSGAHRVIFWSKRQEWPIIVSRKVLDETEKNLPHEFSDKLQVLLKTLDFTILETLDEKILKQCQNSVDEKDVHVLVGALQAGADYLLTYNKKHFLTKNFLAKKTKLQVLNPKDFIAKVILHS